MNSKLQRLIDAADDSGVNLSQTDIDSKYNWITFYQSRESRRSFRTVKRWVGGFKAAGTPPYVKLEKHMEINYLHNGEEKMDNWQVKWDGAYECKSKGYDCRAALFDDEAADHIADIDVEDSQLNTTGL
jgi:hypothetical protein